MDVHQSWLDQALGPPMPPLPEVPTVQHFEVISPAANADAFLPGNTLTQLVAPTKSVDHRPAAASSPDSTDVEPDNVPSQWISGYQGPGRARGTRPAETSTRRDRSRSPLPVPVPEVSQSAIPSHSLFRLDQPADYLYWLTLQFWASTGQASEAQALQLRALDQSLRDQISVDSGPLGIAAGQPFPVLLHTLSPMFAIWHMTGRR